MSLFIVATPIGNLEDISLRALRVLREVDLVAAENVAQTKKLLTKYDIATPTTRIHQHSQIGQLQQLVSQLTVGKDIAYVSDAGTPNVSDPGGQLVAMAREAGIKIVPIPGASAVTALLSVAGIPTDTFMFVGFLPKKKGRQSLWAEIANLQVPVVLFESPNRVVKTLQEVIEKLGDRRIVVGRELTKLYEEIVDLKASQLIKHFTVHPPKGEFVIIITEEL